MALPMPEDVIIYGALGKVLSKTLDLTTGKGILYASLIFEGTGMALIVLASVVGGSYIRNRLKAKVKDTAARAVKYLNYVI
jgi:hypothetical protein